jgi:SAM-dependent methyltransferase
MSTAASTSATAAPSAGVHQASEAGFSLQTNQLYDAGRPAYTDEAVDWLLQKTVLPAIQTALDAPVPSTIVPRVYRLVDLGAGTGIFTRCLSNRVDAFRSSHSDALDTRGISFEIVAVEPVEGMRQRFVECSPGLGVVAGSGSSMPTIADGTVDAIFAAQAFHWFATQEALEECARVLKPGGSFAPIWNTRDTSAKWVREIIEDFVDPLYPADVPRQQTKQWMRAFEASDTQRFELATSCQWKDTMVQRGDASMVIGRIFSISVVAALPAAEQAIMREKMLTLLATHPDTKDTKEYAIPYVTEAFVYRLK